MRLLMIHVSCAATVFSLEILKSYLTALCLFLQANPGRMPQMETVL